MNAENKITAEEFFDLLEESNSRAEETIKGIDKRLAYKSATLAGNVVSATIAGDTIVAQSTIDILDDAELFDLHEACLQVARLASNRRHELIRKPASKA